MYFENKNNDLITNFVIIYKNILNPYTKVNNN